LSSKPIVKIAGQVATVTGSGPYTATYTMLYSDTNGLISYTVDFQDNDGSAGVQVNSTTDLSSVVYEKFDYLDDDNNVRGFAGGVHKGTDASSGNLVLSSNTNTSELDNSWTPDYNNIVGYWNMNGATGVIADGEMLSGSVGPDGTLKNSNAAGFSYTDSKLNNGLSFDGVDDHVDLGDFGDPGTQDFSFSLWFRTTETNHYSLIAKSYYGGANNRWFLVEENNGGLYLQLQTSGGSAKSTSSNAKGYNDGRWHHVVGSFDRDSNMSLFLDGKLIDAKDISSANGIDINSSFFLFLGAYNSNGSAQTTIGAYKFAGDMDEVALWHGSALSEAQVKLIYDRQKPEFSGTFESRIIDSPGASSWNNINVKTPLPFYKELTGDVDGDGAADSESSTDYSLSSGSLSSGLVGLWQMNESSWAQDSVGDVIDSSGHGNHGTVKGDGVSINTNGKFRSTGEFGGDLDFVDIIDSGVAPVEYQNLSETITVSALVKPTSYDVVGTGNWTIRHTVIELRTEQGGGAHYPFTFGIHDAGKIGLGVTDDYTSGDDRVVSNSAVPLDVWTHIAVTISDDDYIFYLNGKVDGSGTFTAANGDRSVGSTVSNMQIGIRSVDSGAKNTNEFVGYLDEIALWNRALVDSKILNLYRRGANRLKYQIRTCDDSACSGESWLGPDGTNQTYYSELQNVKTAGIFSTTGDVQTDAMNLVFPEFSALVSNQYFQYRVIMESDDENLLCSGATCVPSIESVTVTP